MTDTDFTKGTMTKTQFRAHPIWHETSAEYDGRTLLVSESASCLMLRLKGTREIVELPYVTAFLKATMLKAEAAGPVRHRHTVKRGNTL